MWSFLSRPHLTIDKWFRFPKFVKLLLYKQFQENPYVLTPQRSMIIRMLKRYSHFGTFPE